MEIIVAIVAIVVAVLALLVAGVALFTAIQASRKGVDKKGLATVAELEEARTRLTALETVPAITWEEVTPYLEEWYYPKKVIRENFVGRTEYDAMSAHVGALAATAYVDKNLEDLRKEFEAQLDVVTKGVVDCISAEEVDQKIAKAIENLPKGSTAPALPALPQTERRSVMLENVVTSLVEGLQVVSQGMPSKSRSEIEAEINAIETRGVEEHKTLQQTRTDANRRLSVAEAELKSAERALLPLEPTEEMAEAHVERTMPNANYKAKGEEFDRYMTKLHPALQRKAAEKVAECQRSVDEASEALKRARAAQEAFQRDMQRTPAESKALSDLKADLDLLDRLSARVSAAQRALRSAPASNAPPPPPRDPQNPRRLPPPPPPRALSEKPIGYVPEEEILSVSDSIPPPPDSDRAKTWILDEDQRKTVVKDDEDQRKTVVKDDEERRVAPTFVDTVVDGKACPRCGEESLPEAKFCADCGTPFRRDV